VLDNTNLDPVGNALGAARAPAAESQEFALPWFTAPSPSATTDSAVAPYRMARRFRALVEDAWLSSLIG
jgi:hypothetical protein